MRGRFVILAVLGIAILCQLSICPAAEPPSRVIDLSCWKLTVPYNTERKGNPDEIVQPELNTFQDTSCFSVSKSKDGVVFRARCDGLTTKNSEYPRSELREMKRDGKSEASWETTDGKAHSLLAVLAITHTPAVKKHVVCTQIHGAKDDIMAVRLEGSKLLIERDRSGDIKLDHSYKLGTKFKLKIQASGGRIKVWYNDSLKMDWEVSRTGCYFRAGCYTHSNTKKGDRPDSYGEVVIHKLQVTHSKPDPEARPNKKE
ncbi:MAG: polysaccharide lyase family 7 protein [Planctomycetota bacterium]|jgi:poly(beta-D-mannuronate) lyase